MSVANGLLKLLNFREQPLKLRRFKPRHLGQDLTCQNEMELGRLPAYSFGREQEVSTLSIGVQTGLSQWLDFAVLHLVKERDDVREPENAVQSRID